MDNDNDNASSSKKHVTGRGRRTKTRMAAEDESQNEERDDFRESMHRAVAKRKQQQKNDINPATQNEINKYLSELNDNQRKVTSTNCFDTKTPLDMFSIEDYVSTDMKIQDMAVVLDTTQQIYSYRVDRLYQEVKAAMLDLCRGNTVDAGENEEPGDGTKKKKKKNASDGMADMEAIMMDMDEQDQNNEARDEDAEGDQDEHMDDSGDDGIEGAEWDENCNIERNIKQLLEHRLQVWDTEIFRDASSQMVPDEKAIEVQNTEIDWLRSNAYFQKAASGEENGVSSSFRSLLFNGIYSEDGREFKLHPRVVDPSKNERIRANNAKFNVISNMRNIVCNAMADEPYAVPNSLMLEVTNRPKTGQFRMMRAPENVVGGNQANEITVLIPTAGTSGPASTIQDITVFESGMTSPEIESAMTISDGAIAGPSNTTERFQQPRMILRTASMATSIGEEPSGSGGSDTVQRAKELESVPYSEIIMDDSVEGIIPGVPSFPTYGLTAILDVKTILAEKEDDESKKIWKKGFMAEEWDDQAADYSQDILPVMTSGIDSYVKAMDFMTNADIVKMVFNRESLAKLEMMSRNEEFDEVDPTARRRPEVPDKYYILKPSDAYMKLFPQDRKDHFVRIDEEEGIPIAVAPNEEIDEDEDGGAIDYDYVEGGGDDIEFNEGLVANINETIARQAENVGEDNNVADAFFGGIEREAPSTSGVNQMTDLNESALGIEEIPELMTADPPEEVVGIRPEVEADIRNLGKPDNSHWKLGLATEAADAKLGKKKKEKRARKMRITADDFMSYFEETTEADQVEKISSMRCSEIRNPAALQLKDSQIFMSELSTESKPHLAFDFESLSKSGLMFKKKYGKLRFEKISSNRVKEEDVLIDDLKGNVDSDCLHWMLSFNDFRCTLASDLNTTKDMNQSNDEYVPIEDHDGYEEPIHYDDRSDERNAEYLKQQAINKMGEHYVQKYNVLLRQNEDVSKLFRRQDNKYELFDDDDDMLTKTNKRSNNLDAAKHKKCIADILNSDKLSMPNIQYMLEQLSLKQNGTVDIQATSEEDQRRSMMSPVPSANETQSGLTTVFVYNTPDKSVLGDVENILTAFRDMPDYEEESTDKSAGNDAQEVIDPSNPPVQKVSVAGVHTFMSMMLCVPQRMGEEVEPSSVLSFALHLCNENNLQLVQDRTKRNWMSDFLILNQGDSIPEGLEIGDVEEVDDDFWKESLDPCATLADKKDDPRYQPTTSAGFNPKKRGRNAKKARCETPLEQIMEEEMEE